MIPAAMRAAQTRGRRHPEVEHAFRSPYQRDRDRIVHCASFRRLEYKTQVFVNGEGDNYRTRLTHTLEVTQISRTLARALGVNEDLTEAVALSHDLGHAPFGHAGERELNSLLADSGGFDHNLHGLRVVDILERRYADFPGLNLTREVREAFIRHHGPATATEEFPVASPLLEVALTILGDDIAYLAHDIDDGLYSGILHEEDLQGVALWRKCTVDGIPGYSEFDPALRRIAGVRKMIDVLVTGTIDQTRENIRRLRPLSHEDVRACPGALVEMPPGMTAERKGIKKFLFENFYRHERVLAKLDAARSALRGIFESYLRQPETLPPEYRKRIEECGLERTVADYVAGMTDRFAQTE